jgi:hypothetical protein
MYQNISRAVVFMGRSDSNRLFALSHPTFGHVQHRRVQSHAMNPVPENRIFEYGHRCLTSPVLRANSPRLPA